MTSTKKFFLLLLSLALCLAGPSYSQGRKKKDKKKLVPEQSGLLSASTTAVDPREKEVSETIFIEGMKFMMLEEYPKALEQFNRAYSINPHNAG